MSAAIKRFPSAQAAGVHVTRDESTAIERIEAASAHSFHACAPAPVVESMGLAWGTTGGASLTLARRSDNLAFSRAALVGLAREAERGTLSRIVKWYRDRGARRFALDLSPCARPAEIVHRAAVAGFRERTGAAKLIRGAERIEAVRTPFDVRTIGVEDAALWFRVIVSTWTAMRPHERWFASRVAAPGWTHYVATRDGAAVAAAAMFVDGEFARLTEAVTLRGYRRMGAQGALIARRVKDGLDAGVTTFTTETAPPLPRMRLVSYANMLRAGFRIAYVRPSFVYDLQDR